MKGEKKSFVLFCVIFLFIFVEMQSQNTQNLTLARDKFVGIYPLNNSTLNGPKVGVKILPEMPSGCITENRIVLECINCLANNGINYISFDLFYEDCYGIKWKKKISLPANSGSSVSIGGKAFINSQREQIIYGLDNSNINNGHFTYKAEMAGEIANIRVSNKYEGGTSQPLVTGIQIPSKIYATNGDGTINTEVTPAEKNTKVLLTWQGGQLSAEGKWRLYKDNDYTSPVYEGNEVFHLFTAGEFKPSTLITLTAIDKNGVEYNGKKELKIFINLRESEREPNIESVTIGSQVWQTMNLNVDRFRNGDLIINAISEKEWEEAGKNRQPAWCYYDNDYEKGKIYGKLYNWYAVNDSRGLCAKGWHVPSDSEWTTLTNYLGGEIIAGGKMKSVTGWIAPNTGATNESGFTGLPGGYRNFNAEFSGLGSVGFWWSSSDDSSNFAWALPLDKYNGNVNRDYDRLKDSGFSVRCLRD
jgi:uncharacterized protein (TIGR02145 family)